MTNTTNKPDQVNICVDRTDLDLLTELVEYGTRGYRAELLDGFKDEMNNLKSTDIDDYVELVGNFKDLMDQIDRLERRIQVQSS